MLFGDFALAFLDRNTKNFLEEFAIAALFELQLMELGPAYWIVDYGGPNDLGDMEPQATGGHESGVAVDEAALTHVDGPATFDAGGTVGLDPARTEPLPSSSPLWD